VSSRALLAAASLASLGLLWLGSVALAQQEVGPDPSLLIQVLDSGNPCNDCWVETDVFSDGSGLRDSAGTRAGFQVDDEQVEQLQNLLATTDLAALGEGPSSDACASTRVYVFSGVTVCGTDLDHAQPLIALVDEIVALAGPSSTLGYLEGQAAIGPLQPVERVGASPPTPSPAACTARGLVIVAADSGSEVQRFAFGPDCTYRVALGAGTYRVELDRRGIDLSKSLPQTVTITAGQTTRLDVSIDTGIR
jgi:hypothetical protein